MATFPETLLVNLTNRWSNQSIYWIDRNPIRHYEFIVGCDDGFVRMFDLRNTIENIPQNTRHSISTFRNTRFSYPSHAKPTCVVSFLFFCFFVLCVLYFQTTKTTHSKLR